MTTDTRRTILRHAVAVDLVVMAIGIGYLFPGNAIALFGAFLVAVAISAWIGGDEVGLSATAYSVIALSLLFRKSVDPTSLMTFAATGAVVSTLARVARTIQRGVPAEAEERKAEKAGLPVLHLPFAIGLPILAVVIYTDVSDVMMETLAVPSVLQPLILLLTVVVWKYRHILQPRSAAIQPVVLGMLLFALVIFASGIWAKEIYYADKALSEVIKASFILVLAASLCASWKSLRQAFMAIVASAAVLSSLSLLQVTTGRFADAFGGLVELKSGTIYGDVAGARAAGPPVSDPNFYARILLMAIPLAVGLAMTETRPRRKVLYAGAAAVIAAAVLATYSRGAMVTMGVMAGLLLFAFRAKPKHVAWAAVAAIVGFILLPDAVARRFLTIEALLPDNNTGAQYDSSIGERELLIRTGLKMFDANPLFGVGAGQYGVHYTKYANQVGSSWVDYDEPGTEEHPHGLYVEIASENGAAGLAAYGFTILAAFLSLQRARRALLARGDTENAALVVGVAVAIAGYLLASVFLHESHHRYIALYLGFVCAIARLAFGTIRPVET